MIASYLNLILSLIAGGILKNRLFIIMIIIVLINLLILKEKKMKRKKKNSLSLFDMQIAQYGYYNEWKDARTDFPLIAIIDE